MGYIFHCDLFPSVPDDGIPSAPAPRQRYVKRGGYVCCIDCNLAVEYCNCAKRYSLDQASGDGNTSSLTERIASIKAKQ